MPDTMPDSNFIQFLMTMGVGGVLAGMMFFFYRKDAQANADRLVELIKDANSRQEAVLKALVDNTIQTARLVGLVDALHRRMDAETDERR